MLIGLISLGCCKNLVDSQNALSFLKASGHTFTNDPSKAEVIIINTCGFINDAKEESINTILEMADYKQHHCKYLIVMGCLVQRYLQDLKKELPEVDLFITIDEYPHLPEIFNDFLKSKTICALEPVLVINANSAYLRIADGCSNKCAYCAIPLIRKEFKSVDFEVLIAQAKKLEEMGIKELNIIAQDTSRYGIDLYDRYRLADLLIELNKMDFKWIRVLYMYPDEIVDNLLEAMKVCDKVIPYFDIPIQHCNNRMLKLMNRRGSKEHILEVLEKIRKNFKNAVLRTTIIVGFPSESDEEFNELLQFIKDTKWHKLGAFAYSLEEDTAAYDMDNQIDEDIKQKRLEMLMETQQKIELEINKGYIDQEIEVLVETQDSVDETLYQGRAIFNGPDDVDGHVRFTSSRQIEPGDFVKIKVTQAYAHDLFGVEVC